MPEPCLLQAVNTKHWIAKIGFYKHTIYFLFKAVIFFFFFFTFLSLCLLFGHVSVSERGGLNFAGDASKVQVLNLINGGGYVLY